MAKESLIAGLDIGSAQVCCVAGIWDDSQKKVHIIEGKIVPCDGIKAGSVIDIQEASKSIEKAFNETEKVVNGQIDTAVLSLRGDFIESDSASGTAQISRGDINESDIGSAMNAAEKSMNLPQGREVLQMIPKKYILDGKLNVVNPVGMEAVFIQLEACAFTAASVNLKNILRAANSIKINCSAVYSYTAASEILWRKEEKESGCLVVDFGGYTTGLVYYFGGILQYSDEIPIGSEHITMDLMRKLKTSRGEAERIKIEHGAAFCHPDKFQNRDFDYIAADAVTKAESSRQEIVENAIMIRMDQILCYIAQAVEKRMGAQSVPSNIILTGGGCRLELLTDAFEKFFDGIPYVRIGVPIDSKVSGKKEIITNPSYSSAIGAIHSLYSNYYASPDNVSLRNSLSKIGVWLKERL
ncbi:MAG: cell division protein FtsA [Elusimicrobiota bacterium]|nr:cell division protein FtsA [Elusimicrobiota bacterium]